MMGLDLPIFHKPEFTPSDTLVSMGADLNSNAFKSLWEQSKLAGPFVAIPDPTDKNPNRTGYGVRFNAEEHPEGGKKFQDEDYMAITRKGGEAVLKDFEEKRRKGGLVQGAKQPPLDCPE